MKGKQKTIRIGSKRYDLKYQKRLYGTDGPKRSQVEGVIDFALIGGIDWFAKGGWAMYPLVILSIWTIFVILERWIYNNTLQRRVERDLESVLRGGAPLPNALSIKPSPKLKRNPVI